MLAAADSMLLPLAQLVDAGVGARPWIALVVGFAIVLGMILGARANAFFALLVAAIAVSLIAPGEMGEKVTRVLKSFGGYAGDLGVLIAAAAVIGKCLMVSGAADRIVQAAVGVTGEKRAPWALTGSGFVLSVPVFFDTVFYLLVPLARSLFRRTERNYLLYLCAIAAGGAITHTLVPPTPGPLFMAKALDVNIGTMIFVGALIAIPAAIAGLIAARVINSVVTVPFREIATNDEPAAHDGPWEESEAGGRPLPGLFVSLLPVLLPVALIAIDTGIGTFQTAQRIEAIAEESVERQAFLRSKAGEKEFEAIATSLDGARGITAIVGNPSFALLIAAAISVWLVYSSRGLSRDAISDHVEDALASAGVIILITAAGGAFGAMLRVAGVGDAIAGVAQTNNASGLAILLIAWLVAAVMKIAQGSSTTAMITVSGIFGGSLASAAILECHPVYLCTAIGAGSLMGSWMNDSGFWIFTKMGGLTESESLKSWTPILAVLSIAALLATLVLATVMPMTPETAATAAL